MNPPKTGLWHKRPLGRSCSATETQASASVAGPNCVTTHQNAGLAPLDSHQKPHKARASCQLLLTHMPSRRPVTLSCFMDVQMEAGNEARLSPRTQKVLKLSLPDFHMLF